MDDMAFKRNVQSPKTNALSVFPWNVMEPDHLRNIFNRFKIFQKGRAHKRVFMNALQFFAVYNLQPLVRGKRAHVVQQAG
ncbi:hypothetical protein SDC9_170019 [bioreactor metagenome]|uniref:Uncharacterized protein n=1 Tax=bioreactor metagenome TaxID=1076179 RepID=A0A645G946_9ZZZZ